MHKLYVMSIDSLQTSDLPYLSAQKNFGEILPKAAVVKNVREVYPTLTYPIHTTIITGVKPSVHGIAHNQMPSIEKEKPDWSIMGSDWNWYSEDVKVPTLVDAANKKGLVTASVLWPVMGGQKPCYNFAEIWPNSHEPMRTTFERACTPELVELYYDRYVPAFDWEHRTDMDSYGVPIACDVLRRFQPDFMLQHVICLDHERHVWGDHGEGVIPCLNRVDRIVGEVLQAAKDAGTYADTNFIFLGDHGQIDIQGVFNLNVLFREYGLIRTDENGRVLDYDAYSFSAGFSAHIILKDRSDREMEEKVLGTLQQIALHHPKYMGRIFTAAEALREEGLSGEFSFVAEGADGVIFDNPVTGPVYQESGQGRYNGMHGHHPSKGPKPPFIAFGPDIRAGAVIESADMLDECPTLAKLLGVEMPLAAGKPFDIFR